MTLSLSIRLYVVEIVWRIGSNTIRGMPHVSHHRIDQYIVEVVWRIASNNIRGIPLPS
jgi:hypothetical protein